MHGRRYIYLHRIPFKFNVLVTVYRVCIQELETLVLITSYGCDVLLGSVWVHVEERDTSHDVKPK
jgi:hypothetical protein